MHFIPHAELKGAGPPVPISQTREDDIFVVSYPKSGATWLQNLISGLVHRVDPATTPDTVIQELVPDVHYKSEYQRYGNRSFFKSHSLPDPQYRNVVYLLRDGRDAMVSYCHHMGALESPPMQLTEFLVRPDLFPCRWHNHVEAWLENPFRVRLITIRYEDMLRDPVAQLRRLCAFIGVNGETAFLELVAERSSFNNLQDKEARFGLANPRWPRDVHFFRRGQSGTYREEMPEEALRVFLKDAAPTLQRCGYLTTKDEVVHHLQSEVDHLRTLLQHERKKGREWERQLQELKTHKEELAAAIAHNENKLVDRESRLERISQEYTQLQSENTQAIVKLDAIRRSVFTRILTALGIWRIFR